VIVDVGSTDEFVPGTPRVFVIDRREVMVVNWRGDWFGLRNVCPHQMEMLGGGRVVEEIGPGEQIGRLRLTGRPLIACPRHVWTFDLETGQCTVDPSLRERAFKVSVREGRVLVDDRARRARPGSRAVSTDVPGV
jgi:nitrite reductase/ring-hydroxylating ferredoxin subunit